MLINNMGLSCLRSSITKGGRAFENLLPRDHLLLASNNSSLPTHSHTHEGMTGVSHMYCLLFPPDRKSVV